jgi:hypothetical protein
MAGGAGSGLSLDDKRVRPGERIWRLIDAHWYQPDPNKPGALPEVLEVAFSQDISVLRECRVSQSLVDSVLSGRFARHGIVEMSADDIRSLGCVFEYQFLPEWPIDGHFLIRRVTLNNTLKRLSPTLKAALVKLANSRPLLREPK